MRKTWLIFILLLVTSFGLSAWIEPWFQNWTGSRAHSANVLTVALGDSRRLFAKHVYVKADAYFHNGYYPSIFDTQEKSQTTAISQEAGLNPSADSNHSGKHLNEPLDWLDRFSRNFYPSRHAHLGETLRNDPHHDDEHDSPAPDHPDRDPSGDADHLYDDLSNPASFRQDGSLADAHSEAQPDSNQQHQGRVAGLEREILPWLRFSAGLDPNRVETYVIAAYWLRTELHKTNEAEQFLREGLRANPGHQEILFELGRIHYEDRQNLKRARNLWELALKSWEKEEPKKEEPNIFLYAQILGNLGRLEEQTRNWSRAIAYLSKLAEISPRKESIQNWIEELKAKQKEPSRLAPDNVQM